MSRWGHEILLVVPDYTQNSFYTVDDVKPYLGQVFPNVHVVSFPAEPLYTTKGMNPRFLAFTRVRSVIERFRPELIQVESPERLYYGAREPPGVDIARQLGIPSIGLHHTNYVRSCVYYSKEPGFGAVIRFPGVIPALQNLVAGLYNSYDVALTDTDVAAGFLREYGVKNARKVRPLDGSLCVFPVP